MGVAGWGFAVLALAIAAAWALWELRQQSREEWRYRRGRHTTYLDKWSQKRRKR